MNFDRRTVVVAALALVAAGCTPTDATFGNAVRQTMAAQVVDPDPQHDGAIPTTEAAKTAAAVKRYRSDTVKQPDSIRTTDTQSGGPQ
ncbi:MAG: hypothetical protein CVT78_13795 [Alphaproteobacteria bacterium HGW-Alphaproteobacteria-17]|nr:MAG: hypothetical protein CVT78_13795 [Alphaproteobacteria bacterium HGW-Alphaproteobacteria-17]